MPTGLLVFEIYLVLPEPFYFIVIFFKENYVYEKEIE